VGTTIQIGDKSIDIDPKTAKIEAKGDNFKISFANFEYITQSEILVDRDGKLITREIKIEKSSKLDNPFARAFTAAQQGGPEMLAFVDSLTDKSTYYPIQIGKAITLSKTPPAAVVAPPVAPAAGAIPEKEIVFPTGKYERHNWTIEIPTTPPTLR
jgi:hypothetical protein